MTRQEQIRVARLHARICRLLSKTKTLQLLLSEERARVTSLIQQLCLANQHMDQDYRIIQRQAETLARRQR